MNSSSVRVLVFGVVGVLVCWCVSSASTPPQSIRPDGATVAQEHYNGAYVIQTRLDGVQINRRGQSAFAPPAPGMRFAEQRPRPPRYPPPPRRREIYPPPRRGEGYPPPPEPRVYQAAPTQRVVPAPAQVETVTIPAANTSHTVTVPADSDWVSSGVQVHGGEIYEITSSGRWKMGLGCRETDGAGTGLSTNLFCSSMGGEPLAGVNFQTLIGRVGVAGQPFAIGNGLTYTAPTEGALYLRANATSLFDNSGAMTVSIAHTGTAPSPTPSTAPRTAMPRSTGTLREVSHLNLSYPQAQTQPDDIAVLIGNGNYTELGRDIPDVTPAHADVDAFRTFATQALGIKPGNIIELLDATSAQMVRVFGNERNPRGQLYDWVKSGRSNVYVYYSGHGAPGVSDGGSYLVPVDADSARIDLNGYPLETLYANLDQLPARSTTVVLEACFSGVSPAGAVIANASPVYLQTKATRIPKSLTVIAAGQADQIASWEPDQSQSLFTKYYLTAMSGEADKAPFGNGDGDVGLSELRAYLADTLTYFARRHYGRDQTVAIIHNGMPLP